MSSTNSDWWTQHSSEQIRALWDRLTEEVCERVGATLVTRFEKQSLALENSSGRILLRGWPRSDSIRFGLWHPDRESAIGRLMNLGLRSRKGPVDHRFRFTLPSEPTAEVCASVLDVLEEGVRGLDAESNE